MRLVGRDTAGAAALAELETEPALAEPGLAHHSDHLPSALERPRQRRLQSRHLEGPADEARKSTRVGDFETSAELADPREIVDTDRLAYPLYRDRAELPKTEVALCHAVGALGDRD